MKPVVLVRKGGEFHLSGELLTELLRAVLAKGKPFRFRARGSSMSPLIKDGDVVTVSPLGGGGPRTGEIVAFLHPGTGRMAIHRIVRRKAGRFFIRGDNTWAADGDLPAGRILGAVTGIERGGRNVNPAGQTLGPAFAFLSRTGSLARGLSVLRALTGRAPKRTR